MLNWLQEHTDPHIREGAVGLQSSVHQKLVDEFGTPESAQSYLSSGRNAWRQLALIKSRLVMGTGMHGTILEIGAGVGWCSSMMSMVETVDKVYCLDYDPVSVEMLMPLVQKAIGADSTKIERVLGSFNNMPLENEIDMVVSIGALHHSEHLFSSLEACFKALKPGGWLFASEPVYSDSETNLDILKRYKKEDPNSPSKYGKVTLHEENSDHYYRISEFVAASYSAKFDVYPFIFDLKGDQNANDHTLQRRQTVNGFYTNVLYPYFAANPANPQFDQLMLMLQKPVDGGVDLGHKISAP
jgi:SAM-dependent methyltransferase